MPSARFFSISAPALAAILSFAVSTFSAAPGVAGERFEFLGKRTEKLLLVPMANAQVIFNLGTSQSLTEADRIRLLRKAIGDITVATSAGYTYCNFAALHYRETFSRVIAADLTVDEIKKRCDGLPNSELVSLLFNDRARQESDFPKSPGDMRVLLSSAIANAILNLVLPRN